MPAITINATVPRPDGTTVPAQGDMMFTPTLAYRGAGPGEEVLPKAFMASLVNGAGTVTLAQTGPGWAWRVDKLFAGVPTSTEYVQVNATDSAWVDLVRVDPATLTPAPAALGPSWDAAVTSLVQTTTTTTYGALSAAFVGSVVDVGDTLQKVYRRTSFEDTLGGKGALVDIEHRADGSGGTTQAYGLDIHNNPGARSAIVVHQYSNAQAAIQLDNTDTNAMIVVKNTNNPTKNPGGAAAGTSATGKAFSLVDTAGTEMFSILGRGELLMNPGADAAGHAIEIVGKATSAKRLFKGTMNGPQTAVEIVGAAGSAGFWPLLVTGWDYGPRFTTSQDGASKVALTVEKNGTGLGVGFKITNKGTGNSVEVASATATLFAITAAGLPKWNDASTVQTTVGAAGAASALPATPSKYLKVVGNDGVTYVVPAYAAA